MTSLMALVAEAPDEDLLQIRDWLEQRFEAVERARPFSDDELMLWRLMGEALRARAVHHIPPLAVFVRQSRVGRRRFSEGAEHAAGFLEQACGGAGLRLVEREAVLRACLDCLAARLIERRIPLTPFTMFCNLSMLPAAVEAAFPGYAANEMLHQVVLMRR